MAIKFTNNQIKFLNEWARTQPNLRGVFNYTNLQLTEKQNPGAGNVGLGDILADAYHPGDVIVGEAFYTLSNGELLPPALTDHGLLIGLSDDDHPQYARLANSGGNTFTGPVTAEAFYIRGPGTGQLYSNGTLGILNSDEIDIEQFLDFTETTEPATPDANHLSIWAEDNNGHSVLKWKDDDAEVFQFARDSVIIARADGAISAGDAVYISGSTGQRPTVAVADYGSSTTMPVVGFARTALSNNQFGLIQTAGLITGPDVSGFSNGDEVWAGSSGGLVNSKPVNPNEDQSVGFVITTTGQGVLFININGSDAHIESITDGKTNITHPDTLTFAAHDFVVSGTSPDATVALNEIIEAEAFYVKGGGSLFQEAGSAVLQGGPTDLVIRASSTLSPTSQAQAVEFESPILVTAQSKMDAANPDAAQGYTLLQLSGTTTRAGTANVTMSGIGVHNSIINTQSASFGNFAGLRFASGWNEQGTTDHTGLLLQGIFSQPQLSIGANAAVADLTNISFHSGVTSDPSVKRATGITTGTMTVNSVYAFQTCPDWSFIRAALGLEQIGAGATVTDYVHYQAGSGGSHFEVEAGGSLTNEYGIRLENISVGDTCISLYSDSAIATMRHQGSVAIGKTTAPTELLDVAGRAKFTDQISANAFYLNDGASFHHRTAGNDFIFDAPSEIAWWVKGIEGLRVEDNGARSLTIRQTLAFTFNGSASSPNITFAQGNDLDTGIYHPADQTIGFTAGGIERAIIGRSGMRVNDQMEAEAFYLEDGGDIYSETSTVAVGGQVGFIPPRLTSTERDALTAQNGMIVFNTTTGKLQGREAGAWVNLV